MLTISKPFELERAMKFFFGDAFDPRDRKDEPGLPLANVKETAESYVIRLDMPGYDPKKIKVDVQGPILTVRGEYEDVEPAGTYLHTEICPDHVERSFRLPENADPAKVEARSANGVLTLTIPKREETRPRAIEVKVKA